MIRAGNSYAQQHSATAFMPDLTPMLDVIFILLIFFILTSNAAQFALEVELPHAEQETTHAIGDEQQLVLHVYATEGKWGLGDKPYDSFGSFKSAVLADIATNPDKPVVIASDKNVTVEKLLKLFSFLQKNQIQAANMLVDQPR